MSGDGEYVAFYSADSTLVSGDLNNANDVYLWSRSTGQLTLVSLNDAGQQGNAASTFPSVSANGGSVLFSSTASNLVSSPLTSTQQLYVRDLASDSAPVVAPLADASVNEGVTFTASGSFSDPDGSTSWAATVDWGDGAGAQPLAVGQDKTFALSKLLAPGTYTVTVSVTDGEGLTGTGTFALAVANVAPSVDAGSDAQVGFGTTFAGNGSFTDPGVSEQYSATVDYGDGSGSVPLALANPVVGALKVRLELPARSAARLEVLDVGGRRLLLRSVGELGAGAHVLDLGNALRPGIYLVRLSQGGERLTSKAVVIQ
jgi:hypothetical protein